jgi:hypothetical protein
MRRLPLFLSILLATVVPAACTNRQDDDSQLPPTPFTAHRQSAAGGVDSLRAGDVRIVTEDSGVDLAMLGDSISTGLSPSVLAKVRRETDTTTVRRSGFGASIERMVKSTVSSAIGTRVSFPLSAVKDVRYEGGAIRFDWTGKPLSLFDHSNVNGRPVLESFRPADAQRFVDAVMARKAASGR